MEFKQLVDAAEKWCSGNPFELIFAEELDERRMDFYAEPGISFYVLCPDNMTGGTDTFAVHKIFKCFCGNSSPFILYSIQALMSDELTCESLFQFIPKVLDMFEHVWSESEDCLPFLQLAQDYISSCGHKTLLEVLDKVFRSFRPLLGLPDIDDDTYEQYHGDVEEEAETDHQQMGVSQ